MTLKPIIVIIEEFGQINSGYVKNLFFGQKLIKFLTYPQVFG